MAIRRDDFPLPDVDDPLTAPYFAGAARGELADHALRRRATAYVWYPSRACPACGGAARVDARCPGAARCSRGRSCERAFLPAFAEQVPFVTALVALDEDPAVRIVDATSSTPSPTTLRGRRCRSSSTFRPLSFPTVPDKSVVVPMFRPDRDAARHHHDLRRPARRRPAPTASPARTAPSCSTDLGADVVFANAGRRDPLFTYLRTSQRHAADIDAVASRRPTSCSSATPVARRGVDPLVTVSITRGRPRRPRRRSRPRPKRCCRRAAAASRTTATWTGRR